MMARFPLALLDHPALSGVHHYPKPGLVQGDAERWDQSGDRSSYAIVCACPAKAAGESRRSTKRRPPKVKGPGVMGRISQAKGPWAGGRPGEFGCAETGADGVTLSGLGQGGNYIERS